MYGPGVARLWQRLLGELWSVWRAVRVSERRRLDRVRAIYRIGMLGNFCCVRFPWPSASHSSGVTGAMSVVRTA